MRGTEKTLAPLPLAATRSRQFGLMPTPSRDSSAKEPTRSDTRPEAVTENSLRPLASLVGAGPEEDRVGLINESTDAWAPSGPKDTPKGVRRPYAKWVSTCPSNGAGAIAVEQATVVPTGDAVPEVEADVAVALKVVSNATALAPIEQATTYR